MNYIGSFFSNIREYYNDLNPATLSGAIDVVIVEREDGTYACSPFHVRFGKRGVFNRREKIVDITINGELVDLHMKLGETGEAFFVEATEAEEEAEIPPLLATSPLPPSYISEAKPTLLPPAPPPSLATTSPFVPSQIPTTVPSSSAPSGHELSSVRESSLSPPRTSFDAAAESDEKSASALSLAAARKLRPRSRRKRRPKTRPLKDDEIFKMDLSDDDRERTPVGTEDKNLSEELNREPLERTSSLPDFLDVIERLQDKDEKVDKIKIRHRKLSSHSVAYLPKSHHVTFAPVFHPRKESVGEVQATKSEGQLTPPKSLLQENIASGFLSDSEVDLKKSETHKVRDDEGANVTWKWGQLPEKNAAKTPDTMTPTMGSLESIPEATHQSGTSNDQGKQSRGMFGMFSFMRRSKPASVPASGPAPVPHPKVDTEEVGNHFIIEVGNYLSDLATENISQSQKERYLALDTFGTSTKNLDDSRPQSPLTSPTEQVQPSAIQPASVESAASKGLSLTATVEVGGKNIELVPLAAQERGKGVDLIVNAFGQDARSSSAYSSMTGTPPLSDTESDKSEKTSGKSTAVHKKTLRLSSEQIMNLPLSFGVNEAEFCIVTKYQGSARCKCNIFLWRYDDKIVISDIDGTITKSDVLGHILPIIGSTWAQAGVAGLYNRIASNGYRFLYLSSRAIGQASFTRDHLKAIMQENVSLPDGPLLLSPKSLFLAFHQEVIVKRPEEFKIACLQDIKALFPKDRNPFFAAYGNKPTDLITYRTVGVPMTRIFTINYQGQLKHETLRHAQSSYSQQTNLVDMLFPPLKALPGTDTLISEHEHAEDFSAFVYWKAPIPDIDAAHLLPAADAAAENPKSKKAKAAPVKSQPVKSTSPVKTAKTAPLIIM